MRPLKLPLGRLVVLACLALALAGCRGLAASWPGPAAATTTPAAGPHGKIRVAVDPTFPPFVTRDARQQLAGFDIDVMRVVAGRAGLGVEFVPVVRDRLLNGVLNCDYDAAISAIGITDALRQQLTFSEPYVTVGQVVVVKKGNIAITGRDTMADMTVGVQKGSPSAAEALNVNNAQPVLYPSAAAAFQDLIAGYIDAVIADQPLAQGYVSIPANSLKLAGDQFGRADYAIAICKQRPELVQQIDDGLAAVQADGTLDRLAQKWFKKGQ